MHRSRLDRLKVLAILGAAYTDDIESIRHERTATTQKVRKIEERLSTELSKLVVKASKVDIFTARQQYGEEVKTIIAAAVQAIFLESSNYVQKFEEDKPIVLTSADMFIMDQQAARYSDSFWRTMATSSNAQFIEPVRALPDLGTVMAGLSTSLAFSLLGEDTIMKAQQAGSDARLMWVSELSASVCVICRPLHGTIWAINDPLLLKPVENSHPNCKCRLLLVDNQGNVLSS